MGHMKDKYNENYFLGGVDSDTGKTFGVLGHAEFCDSKVHERHIEEFEFTRSAVGTVEGKHVIEIGFGRGDFIPLFLEGGVASFTGIDFSESAVRIAKDHFQDSRLRLFQQEAVDLTDERLYDIIGLYDVLEHIPVFEMEAVWKKIRNIIKPGGHIIISTPIFNNPNTIDHSDVIPSVSGMHCNKQTWGTFVRSASRHGFTFTKTAERIAALVRTKDLGLFDNVTTGVYLDAQAKLLNGLVSGGYSGEFSTELEKKLVAGAGRLAVGCVADNKPKFLSQALRLLQSLRWFGGECAGANFFVCVVDGVDPVYAREFERLGAFVRVVERFSSIHPYSNKLRFLELPEIVHYDTLLLLDCDTVVVGDLWPYLDGTAFQAKIVDLVTVPHEIFEDLYPHFGIKLPKKKYKTNPGGTPTVWYCNSGVLVFPKKTIDSIGRAWLRYDRELLENIDLLGEYKTFCDQVSLSLAYELEDVPYSELPIEMNFPAHLTDIKATEEMNICDPVIIHYHDKVDQSGYLLAAPYPNVRKKIEAFNERLHKERRSSFNNKLFWDLRYAEHGDLGSGTGSRGNARAYKRELLRSLLGSNRPRSVLDVGCGDQVVSSLIPDDYYTGVDISLEIVERNKKDYPCRRFICGDIVEIVLEGAEMVICLDVTIHLDTPERYRSFVERLVGLALNIGIVSGYESPPSMEHDITFYHESLSNTLIHAGARNLQRVGSYGNVVVWSFEPMATEDIAVTKTKEVSSLKPVFVVGSMRSGTTLFADLLGEFEGIVNCPFELKNIWSKIGGVPNASARTRERYCPQFTIADIKLGQAQKLTDAFLKEKEKNSAGKSIDAYFLNKNPHLCNKLDFVMGLFPDAHFIWISRSLPFVVASLKALFDDVHNRQKTWHYWPECSGKSNVRCWEAFHSNPPPEGVDPARCFPGGNVRYLAEYWLECNRAVRNFVNGISEDRFLIVQSERLISETEEELSRCLGFLGLPLTLPSIVNERTDSNRNKIWGSRLNIDEHHALLDFVKSNAEDIDKVFPGEGIAEDYLREIKVSLEKSKEIPAALHSHPGIAGVVCGLPKSIMRIFRNIFH